MDTGLQRVMVVGVTGSGKTTFARQLAERLNSTYVEMDALYWEPNWKAASVEDFRERVDTALAGERWVADGNYSKVRDLTWARADTIIWLDYPLPFTLWRLMRRTWRRIVEREVLWNGNRERLIHQVSGDSLFLWAIKSYRNQHAIYPTLLQQPEYGHLSVIYLKSAQAAQQWLEAIPQN